MSKETKGKDNEKRDKEIWRVFICCFYDITYTSIMDTCRMVDMRGLIKEIVYTVVLCTVVYIAYFLANL